MRCFVIVIGCLLFAGCAVRSVYVPTSQNIMLFDDKKQVQGIAYAGINTFQLQAAYNPGRHFEIGLNTCYGTGIGIYEACAGFYSSKRDHHWRYEILGGIGYTSNYAQVDRAFISIAKQTNLNFETAAQYYKGYLQPTLGYFFRIDMYKLDCSFITTCRFSWLGFEKYVYREINKTTPLSYSINKEFYNKNMFLAEPCFTNKVGRRNLYGVFQAMFIVPYSSQIDIRYTKFSPVFLFSLGLQYNLVFKKQRN